MEASPQPRPDLQLVHGESGEVLDQEALHERIAYMQDQLDGAEKEVRAWRARYANLRRDKEREAREDPLWPRFVELHKFWRHATGHMKSGFGAPEFEMAAPILKKMDDEMCHRAILGLAFDPFVTTRKNGSKKKHDGWHLVFGTRPKFEEAACKAPRDWQERRAELLADLAEDVVQ